MAKDLMSIRIDTDDKKVLEYLCKYHGVSQGDMIAMCLRERARRDLIDMPPTEAEKIRKNLFPDP